MKEDKKLREMEPETFPDRRIKFTVDNMGSKHSLSVRPWVLLLAGIILIAALALLSVFTWRGPSASDKELIGKLEKENEFLQDKISGYEAEFDSVLATLDTLNIKPPAEDLDLPSYSGASFGPENKLRVHPGLDRALSGIDLKLADIKQRLDYALGKSQEEQELYAIRDRRNAGLPSIQPTFGEIISGWGMRRHPVMGGQRFHQGIDISNRTGTPVYATADGVVRSAQAENGWGKVVKIDHPSGFMTLYAHLHSFKVKTGDSVSKGQMIGLIGNTGMSTGSHLHYGVYRNEVTLNPTRFMNQADRPVLAYKGR